MARYIGARYVPVFAGDWDQTREYEALTVVQYQGDSYTSKMYVPVGIAISNTQYWIKSANFNQQVAALSSSVNSVAGDVATIRGDLTTLDGRVDDVQNDITALDGRVDDTEADITRIDNFINNDLLTGNVLKNMFEVRTGVGVTISDVGAGQIKAGSASISNLTGRKVLGVVGINVASNNFTLKSAYVDNGVLYASVMNNGSIPSNCNVICTVLMILGIR